MSAPALVARHVSKRFGATVALDGVDLTVEAGQVHAVLGENGAGKSTLMKLLSGALSPDGGALQLAGRAYAPSGPRQARAAGVEIVYQELDLAPHLSVEQNLTLGIEVSRWGLLDRGATAGRVAAALAAVQGPDPRPDLHKDAIVGRLPPAARQLVEIARALMTDARVLILDEPTSSLGLADIEHLFDVITGLTARGVAVIYISHFLQEVQRIAERYTVLRDGKTVATGRVADASLDDLVEAMIGRRLEQMYPRVARERGELLLGLDGLCGRPLPDDVDLALHRGEVVGLAGLVGSGRTELLRALFGLDPVRAGRVRVAGRDEAGRLATPGRRLAQGVGLLSEDRATEGLALTRSVEENLTLSRLAPYRVAGWLDLAGLAAAARRWIDVLDVRTRGPDQRVGELSGGNQQKIAVARLLHHEVDVLLLDEPTRGIDVASKAQLYQLIGEQAAAGKAILMASSATAELLGVCDRIAVLHRGRLVAVRPVSEWSEHAILACAVSGTDDAA